MTLNKQPVRSQDPSDVIKFYKNTNVLITGATGFLGKVLLWKLLYTCTEIGNIYVLLRPKNNVSSEKRLIQLLKGKPFSFKHDHVELSKKVIAIDCDLAVEGLGLSQSDRAQIEDNVEIVLHTAASVQFDAPLKDNIRNNVYGTRSIVNLCDSMKKLKAFVHVSTAYSNFQSRDIGESLQPLERNIDDVVKLVESLPNEACELVTDKLLEGRPNTYTYTKAMAEHFVARHEGKFPISIVRPSIVISSYQEPAPGWIDNINGVMGLGCLASIGVLRTIDWNYYAKSDLVPVDYVANCIICAAYQSHFKSPKKMLIFNMTSGNSRPISWGEFFGLLHDEAVRKPPKKIVRPIIDLPKYHRVNPIKFHIIRLFSELLFAYMLDTILSLTGYKTIMVKITRKMHHGYKILKPFTTNEWNFCDNNVVNLCDSLSPVDKNLFKFDMRDLDWKELTKSIWNGARLYILKEEPTEQSYREARARQTMVTIMHYGLIGITYFAIMLTAYSGFKLVGSSWGNDL